MAEPTAGQLNKRILFEALTQTKDNSGGMVDSWVAATSIGANGAVWAKVNNLSGNERKLTTHGGQVAEARTEFTVRFNAAITGKHRISYGGKLYNIAHVNDYQEQHKFMILTCGTGLNDGR